MPDGKAINAKVYVHQLQQVQDKIPSLFTTHFQKDVLLLHDNIRQHILAIRQKELFQLKWTVLPDATFTYFDH